MDTRFLGKHTRRERWIRDQQHVRRRGKDVVILPTIPSGVITAIPFSMPLSVPRSTMTTFAPTPVVFPITCAATVLDGVCCWKMASVVRPIGRRQFVRQKLILQAEVVSSALSCLFSPRTPTRKT